MDLVDVHALFIIAEGPGKVAAKVVAEVDRTMTILKRKNGVVLFEEVELHAVTEGQKVLFPVDGSRVHEEGLDLSRGHLVDDLVVVGSVKDPLVVDKEVEVADHHSDSLFEAFPHEGLFLVVLSAEKMGVDVVSSNGHSVLQEVEGIVDRV